MVKSRVLYHLLRLNLLERILAPHLSFGLNSSWHWSQDWLSCIFEYPFTNFEQDLEDQMKKVN